MVVTTSAGLIKKGTLAERPNGLYLADCIYIDTATGSTYYNNGSSATSAAWVQLAGSDKVETLQNKTIPASSNTLSNFAVDPFSSSRREGYIIPALTAQASLKGALKGMPPNGTYSYVYDTVASEGYVSRFSTSIVENVGYISGASVNIPSRREWATSLKIRSRVSTTTSSRVYIGFTQNTAGVSASDTPLSSTDIGFLVGFNTATANFSMFRNDGTGAAPSATSFGAVAKDTLWHTYEVTMSDANIVCKLDGGNTITSTTRIPALSTNLYLHVQMQSTAAAAKNMDISKGSFGSDFV